MPFCTRFSARTVALALLSWAFVALVLHLKAEREMQHRSISAGSGIASTARTHDRTKLLLGTTPSQAKSGVVESTLVEDTRNGTRRRTAVVVAKSETDNATWLHQYFPQWEKHIYSVDVDRAELKIPKNKGRESMVYLSYIIDNYDNLADNVLFLHPNRYQWHNDDPDYDGVPMLRRFRIPYLEQEGYVNMRCAWQLGCPDEIKPFAEEGEHRAEVHAGGDYKQAFQVLFPGEEVPEYVGVSCCAQFAATKEKIRERQRTDYERYRKWLLETDLEDSISGRIMEYSWHLIFGKQPVHCPPVQVCYCHVFGLCSLDCEGHDSCQSQYILPPFSTLPKGWPYVNWDYEDRERAGPED